MISLFDVSMIAGDELEERVAELNELYSQLSVWLAQSKEGLLTYQKKQDKNYVYLRIKLGDKWITKKSVTKAEIGYFTLKKYYLDVFYYLSSVLKLRVTHEKYYEIRREIQKKFYDLGENGNLIVPIDISDEDRAKMWNDEPYERFERPVDDNGLKTKNGEQMRSKSEVSIGNSIIDRGYYFKYEVTLNFGKDDIFHPDFAIWDTKLRRVIYWEHFGKMQDPDYAITTVHKIRVYAKHGIVIGQNFIATFETNKTVLGNDIIDLMLEKFLPKN